MKKTFSSFFGLLLLSTCLALTGSAQSVQPGTEIRVQLLDQLDTGKTQPGQEFSATLAEPVRLQSEAVWPKGTMVKGKVVEVVSSGRLSRPASITLQLTQIGSAPIQTETEKLDGQSHGGRNAAIIGSVTAVGAVLGGIAGGGKGALIGALAGAGAGTATAAATGKQEIVLHAETPLAFVIAGGAPAQLQTAAPAPQPYETQAQPQEPPQVQDQAQYQAQGPPQDSSYYEPYAPEQLDNLLAPVALYPDPLLAQLLVAATFPDQIQDADAWVSRSPNSIDYQPWDVSVKAVAHYPTVLSMMSGRLDWTTALGQAYVYQSTDVMSSVQRLRNLALSQGNLIGSPQQQVIVDAGYVQILPAQPRVIFVPAYDPGVIYTRHVYRQGVGFGGFYKFGTGYAIGAWLNYDLDWGSHRVVYDGWDARRVGWRERSRPYVQVNNVYVNNRYETVTVNRTVVDRHVDYSNVERYNSVHHDVTYDNHARFEAERVRNEPSRDADQRRLQPPLERSTDRGIQSQAQPVQPQRPSNVSLQHSDPAPPRVDQPRAEPLNGRPNDWGFRNQSQVNQGQSAQPQHPANADFGRPNQPPTAVAQPNSQPPDARPDDRRFRNQSQPVQGLPAQSQRPNDAGFGRANQPAPAVAQPNPQPPVQNQLRPVQVQPPQSQRPVDASFGHSNQPAPTAAQPNSQPPDARVNNRGNERNIRNEQPANPQQSVVRTVPQPPAQPAAAPPPPAVHAQQQPPPPQQQQQKHDNGNGRGNGEQKDKKANPGEDGKK